MMMMMIFISVYFIPVIYLFLTDRTVLLPYYILLFMWLWLWLHMYMYTYMVSAVAGWSVTVKKRSGEEGKPLARVSI